MKHATTDARLRALERRARLLSASLFALLGLLGLSAFADAGDGVVRGRRIELVDAGGRVRAELAIDDEGSAGLFVKDGEARLRASLTHDAGQSALYLYDEDGTIRIGAAQFSHGGGGLALHGPHAEGAAVLYLDGAGSLTFYDRDGGVTHRIPE